MTGSGSRSIAAASEVRIYTRNLNEITESLPGIVAAVRGLPLTQAAFDGEALWMTGDGPASFQDTVSQIDRDAPPAGIVDVPVRSACTSTARICSTRRYTSAPLGSRRSRRSCGFPAW